MKLSVLAFVCIFIYSSFVFSQSNLKIISYNINGLPSPIKKNKKELFKFIAKSINQRKSKGIEPDIILLQEAFTKSSKKYLVDQLDYPFKIRGPKAKEKDPEENKNCRIIRRPNRPPLRKGCTKGKLLNSGLYVLSKYEIVDYDFYLFSDDCSGFDCYSNKAVSYLKIKLPNHKLPIEIMHTHMNSTGKSAGKKKDIIKAKLGQINKVKKLYLRNRDFNSALLFIGDINLYPSKETYSDLLDATETFNIGETCFLDNSCIIHERTEYLEIFEQTNDQHLGQQGFNMWFRPVYLERGFRDPVLSDQKKRLPSDHYSYEIHYLIDSTD